MDDGHDGTVLPRRRLVAMVKGEDELREQLPDGILVERFVALVVLDNVGVQISAFAQLKAESVLCFDDDHLYSHPCRCA